MVSRAAVKLRKMLTPPLGSQADLARKLGVSPQAVSGWVRGDSPPSLKSASDLEELTGIPASDWLKESDGETESPAA